MAELKKERTTINGVTYEVTQLPYALGHKLLLRLYRTLGPAFGQGLADALYNAHGLTDLLSMQIGPALGRAIRTLAETLTDDDFEYIVDLLSEYTTVSRDGQKWPKLKDEREFLFAGNYEAMFGWLGFALKVNFGGFFGGSGLGGLIEKVKAVAPASPTSSTGTSTASRPAGGTTVP